jgi:hypothetical protein
LFCCGLRTVLLVFVVCWLLFIIFWLLHLMSVVSC